MPEMPKGRRQSGPQITGAAFDPDSLLPWLNGEWPDLPMPDQSRYGQATTDPLGREGPGWKTGSHGLPQLCKGWHYDPVTKRTTKKPEPE